MKSLTTKVAANTLVQIVGRIVLTAISLTTIGLITRALGVAGFGQFQTALAYLAMFTVLADLGFFFILVRDLAQKETIEEKSEFVGNVLSIRTIAALVVYLVAIGIGYIVYHDPIIVGGITLLSISFFALTLQNTLIAVFQSQYRMDKTVIADLIGKGATLGLVVYAMAGHKGIFAIFGAYIIGALLDLLAAVVLANRIIPLSLRFDIKVWKRVLVESAPLGLAVVLSTLYFKIDSVMLSVIKGSYDVGIYGAPYKIIEVILTVPAIFANAILPIYSRYFKSQDSRLGTALQRTFDGLVAMAVPICFGLIATAPKVIQLIGGGEFINASTITIAGMPITAASALSILSLAVLLGFVSPAFSYFIAAGGLQRKLVLPNVVFVIFNVVANLILIPRYSYFAASWTTVATEVLVLSSMIWLVYKHFGKTVKIGKTLRLLMAGLMMYGAVKYVDMGLVGSVVVGTTIYLIAVMALRAITINDFKSMLGRGQNVAS